MKFQKSSQQLLEAEQKSSSLYMGPPCQLYLCWMSSSLRWTDVQQMLVKPSICVRLGTINTEVNNAAVFYFKLTSFM